MDGFDYLMLAAESMVAISAGVLLAIAVHDGDPVILICACAIGNLSYSGIKLVFDVVEARRRLEKERGQS